MNTTFSKLMIISLLSFTTLNTYASVQCYVADKRGHQWMNIAMNEERAVKVAMSYCTTYSPDSETCHQTSCTEK